MTDEDAPTGGGTGRKAVLVFLGQLVGAGLGYVAILAIGRAIDPGAYGGYLFAYSLVGLLMVVAGLGTGPAHQRNVARGVPLDRALGVMVPMRFGLMAAASLVGLTVAFVWLQVLDRTVTDATSLRLILLAFGIHIAAGVRQIAYDTWIAQGRINRVELTRAVDTALSVTLVVAVALAVAGASGRWLPVPGLGEWMASLLGLTPPVPLGHAAVLLGWAYLVGKAVSLVPVAWLWRRDRTPVGRWDPALARETWRYALPLGLTVAIAFVLQYTDVLMLGYFWTSREVGYYGAAQKVAGLPVLVGVTVATLLFPRFSRLLEGGDRAAALATFKRAERYLLIVVLPAAVACLVLPEPVLHIAVGDPFLAGAGALAGLGAWAVVVTLALPLRAKFMAEGKLDVVVRSTTVNAVLNVVLNAVLIPQQAVGFGPAGAAWATFLSSAVAYLDLRLAARKAFAIPLADGVLARLGVAALALGAGWWLAFRNLPATWWDRAWELAGWGVAGGALFVVVLVLLRELGRDDWGFVRHLASPKGLLDEVRGRNAP